MLYIVLQILGYLLLSFSLLPLIRKDYWTFRVFEYPRVQKLILTLIILWIFLSQAEIKGFYNSVFAGLLAINVVYLSVLIYPFTILSNPSVLRRSTGNEDDQISILISNVYQYNKEVKSCLSTYKKYDPDLILLVETDQWWIDELKELEKNYPHRLLKPLDNTYGMALYSKFKLKNAAIKFLVEEDIPSVHTNLLLPSGKEIRLYGLHPTPPVPNENPRSTERDKEILLVAKEVKKCKLPVIVAGDLNDVAWSYTTELFSKTSGLLDPRRGRGFFNTFHAKNWLMRFPLDHVFCSNDFTLIDLQRLPNCGSDHFPIYIKLQYNLLAKAEQEEPQASPEEKALAEEKITKPT